MAEEEISELVLSYSQLLSAVFCFNSDNLLYFLFSDSVIFCNTIANLVKMLIKLPLLS